MKKRIYLLYVGIVLVILLFPFVGMSLWANDEAIANEELSEWPQFKVDGEWNVDYLQEAGAYFEDHFAFRRQMITANSVLWEKCFKVSAANQVVAGEDGWLYFAGTLDDYLGRDLLSERELYNVVHNLSMVQDYVEGQGAHFYLMLVPNKNTLYGEYMPYYYRAGESSNLKKLILLMENAGIHYVDLLTAFETEEEALYFQRDSHWNNEGALLAYRVLMDETEKKYETYLNVPRYLMEDHYGDIEEMIYPSAVKPEEEIYFDKEWGYHYQNDVGDNMDSWIETENLQKEGVLLMYRDSFGEAILPFLADEYGRAYFSRLVPYNLNQVLKYQPDTVVIEKVERNISDFATDIPVMESSLVEYTVALEKQTDTTIESETDGGYLIIRGEIDWRYLETDSEIYVSVSDASRGDMKTYQAFYTLTNPEGLLARSASDTGCPDGDTLTDLEEALVSADTLGNGNGYQIYLRRSSVPSEQFHVNIILKTNGQSCIVASKDMQVKWEE